MNIKNIIRETTQPILYEKGTSTMWTDEHISKQLLNVHLNPELELASRKAATISSTVDWILDKAGNKNLNILDLGCGPGLYAEQFAKKGHKVTGVDFSKCSIDYAESAAVSKNLNITYVNENYLQLNFEENSYDLVIMIYTDFGVLMPEEREKLLTIIGKVLNPGGVYIFDVLNDKDIERKVTPKNWEAAEKGFWKNKPYIALSESFLYKDEKVILYQHYIEDEQNQVNVYRFWTHFFSHDDIKSEFAQSTFSDMNFYEDVLPKGDLWNGENVTFCVAVNKK